MKQRRYTRRQGRCYEIAYHVLIDNPMIDARLVHGRIEQGAGLANNIDHARIEVDGSVWDPVHNQTYDKKIYYIARNATAVKTYTGREAAELLAKENHYGPWGEPGDMPSDAGSTRDTVP